MASTRLGNLSSIFNSPSCTFVGLRIQTVVLVPCASTPSFLLPPVCFHHLLPGLCKGSPNFFPHFQPLLSNLVLSKQTGVCDMPVQRLCSPEPTRSPCMTVLFTAQSPGSPAWQLRPSKADCHLPSKLITHYIPGEP